MSKFEAKAKEITVEIIDKINEVNWEVVASRSSKQLVIKKSIECIVDSTLQELEARTIERCAKVAEETKYNRLCEPHEAECRTTHHGCEEISKAIRDLRQ